MPLTFQELHRANMSRVTKWHSLDSWSALEWAGAMAGEAGEAANAAKKLKRLSDGIASINDGDRHMTKVSQAEQAVLKEVADTIIYGLLLMARCGADGDEIDNVICEVFNKKSEEYGFPERIGLE